jgi:hypothetical protein
MADFTENDLRDIERDRDLPPDEPHPRRTLETCVECGRVIAPADRYEDENGYPRHLACLELGDR